MGLAASVQVMPTRATPEELPKHWLANERAPRVSDNVYQIMLLLIIITAISSFLFSVSSLSVA
jgi:hypothetical protein